MWESYTALKAVIEQKDEVINQLYNQLSDLQDKVNTSHSVQHSLFSPSTSVSGKGGKQTPKELQVLADREFYAADKDGDGRISREEWRNWIQDKHNLIQEHNEVKTVLMNEIKNLRKALGPQAEQIYNEVKRHDEVRSKQEEELVNVHIENDRLKSEINLLNQKMKDLEEEKGMVESDFNEQIKSYQKQLSNAVMNNEAISESKESMFPPSTTIDSPYAYNFPQDQSRGIQAKSARRPVSDAPAANMDLLALANMNTQFNEQDNPYQSMTHPGAHRSHQESMPPWQVDTYQAQVSRLGVDAAANNPVSSQVMNIYPPTLALRSPDEEDYGGFNRVQSMESYRNDPYPPSAPQTMRHSTQAYLNNLQEQHRPEMRTRQKQQQFVDSPQYSNDERDLSNERVRPISASTISNISAGQHYTQQPPKRTISPSAFQASLGSVYDHPLRNALRAETKSSSVPGFVSAPSPYTAVRSKVSTTNYNNTIGSRMKPLKTQLKTGTVLSSKRAESPTRVQSNFPRGSNTRGEISPSRVARKSTNEEVFYEYLNKNGPNNRLQVPAPMDYNNMNRPLSPTRFMHNTNSWKEKIKNPTSAPDAVIRASNWK
jgi:hypothetical protein